MMLHRSRFALVALGVVVFAGALLGNVSPVFADLLSPQSVPAGQLVPNPGNANLNSVVQLDTATQFVGTGSIICTFVGAEGNGHFVVLTADHVIGGGANRIAFQNSAVPGTPAGPPDYAITQTFRKGSTGTVDIALAVVDYGMAPDAFFNAVVSLKYTSIDPPGTTQFTSVGFGNTGTPNVDMMGNLTGYTRTAGTVGTKRFQNNVVTGTTANAGGPTYNYKSVNWQLDIPGIAGEGYTYDGDSGSPYFTTTAITLGGVPNVFTNNIFGVHTLGVNGAVVQGSPAAGVLLTAAEVTWIDQRLAAVCIPEPSTILLLTIGTGLILFVARGKRKEQGSPERSQGTTVSLGGSGA